MGDSKLLQGATLLPTHGRAGDRKHGGVFQGPEKTGECSKDPPDPSTPRTGHIKMTVITFFLDLPASACAVSGLTLQDHAELLEEERKGTTFLPGNTRGPSGAAAGSM